MKTKHNVISALFGVFLIVGLVASWSYPVTSDEPIQRQHSLVSARYMAGLISPDWQNIRIFQNLPDVNNYLYRFYGVTFQLPLVALEIIFNLDSQNSAVWHTRHLAVFLFFFIACIFFYRLLLARFHHRSWALIGVACLVFYPRVFSTALHNIKDSVFLSAFIISIYYSYKFIRKQSRKNLLALIFFSALATNSRIIGIMVPYATVMFLVLCSFLKIKKYDRFRALMLCLAMPACVWLLWPAAWADITTIAESFHTSKNFSVWTARLLLAGDTIYTNELPWYYIPLWIAITTPPAYLPGIVAGVFVIVRNFRFSLKESFDVYILSLAILPILAAILFKSTLYTGWRHFYFLSPLFIYIAITGFIWLKDCIPSLSINKIKFNLVPVLLTINFIWIGSWMYSVHPLYNYYFNALAGSNPLSKYDAGTWDTVHRQVIDYLLENYPEVRIQDDLSGIHRNLVFYSSQQRRRIRLVSSKDAEYKVLFLNDNIRTNPHPKNVLQTFGLPNQPSAYIIKNR